MIGSLLNFSGLDLLVILAIIILLFGATRIPALAKGLRKTIAAFREGKSDHSPDFKDRAPQNTSGDEKDRSSP
jgi:sec-independent protein translocase protein TatA